jgi:hypothetical protein
MNLFLAQRRLPSMMMAMCCGSVAGARLLDKGLG